MRRRGAQQQAAASRGRGAQHFTFEADDSNVVAGATITGYVGPETDVTIPAVVTVADTVFTVTAIGDRAFFGSGLTSVTIPGGVTSIGRSAFAHNALTGVAIPRSVTSIGGGAFATNKLTTVTVPGSVANMGPMLFAFNPVTSLILLNSLRVIGAGAFVLMSSLTSVRVPASVTHIGAGAFAYSALTTVTFAGPAPLVVGADAFGAATLVFSARHGEPAVPAGFTSPRWNGSPTRPSE